MALWISASPWPLSQATRNALDSKDLMRTRLAAFPDLAFSQMWRAAGVYEAPKKIGRCFFRQPDKLALSAGVSRKNTYTSPVPRDQRSATEAKHFAALLYGAIHALHVSGVF
jgi:hypothetical protein